jgi:hypothetical protein
MQLRLMGCGSEVDVALVEIDGRQLQQEDAQAPTWFGQVSMADVVAVLYGKVGVRWMWRWLKSMGGSCSRRTHRRPFGLDR